MVDALEAQGRAAEDLEQRLPTAATYREALTVLDMLPPNIAPPEPAIEPSGAIAWSWEWDDGRFLVLAVNGTGKLQLSAIVDGAEYTDTSALSERWSDEEVKLLSRFRSVHG